MDTGSAFYEMISKKRYGKKKLGFELKNLHQNVELVTIRYKGGPKKGEKEYATDTISSKNVNFIDRAEKQGRKKRRYFGKSGQELMLGTISFSRVYFNEEHDKCFYYFAFLGGN